MYAFNIHTYNYEMMVPGLFTQSLQKKKGGEERTNEGNSKKATKIII